MNRDASKRFVTCALPLLLMLVVNDLQALGIRQPEQGAAAIAQGDAFVAQADDPSAVYYNPAGLTQLKGTVSMSGVYVLGPEVKYEGSGPAAGVNKGTQDQIFFLPHFYGVSDFGSDWFRAAFGVYTPFGQTMDWGNNNSFRYVSTRSELQMVNINPTLAFAVCETLSVGIGYDLFHCDTDIRRAFPFVVPGPAFVGEGNFRFQGDGIGHGGNVGVHWKPFEKHHFGISYRSPVEVEFQGHAKVNTIPLFLGLGDSVNGKGHADFTFPQVVQFGYAFWPTAKWKLEVDADWANWDQVNAIALKSKTIQGTFGLTRAQMKTKLNWEDSWIISLGSQYELRDNLFLRGGWYWSEDSVPERNFNPFLPDSDRTGVSLGLGFRTGRFWVDVAYQFNMSLDRKVSNKVGNNPFPPISQSVNGEYETYSQAGAISVGFNF